MAGLNLDYRGDLSGGGFLIRAADGLQLLCSAGPPSVVRTMTVRRRPRVIQL